MLSIDFILLFPLKFAISSVSDPWGLPLFTCDGATEADDDAPPICMVVGAAAAADADDIGSFGGVVGFCVTSGDLWGLSLLLDETDGDACRCAAIACAIGNVCDDEEDK